MRTALRRLEREFEHDMVAMAKVGAHCHNSMTHAVWTCLYARKQPMDSVVTMSSCVNQQQWSSSFNVGMGGWVAGGGRERGPVAPIQGTNASTNQASHSHASENSKSITH